MCGIGGVVGTSPAEVRPNFSLSHRGPDGESWSRFRDQEWSGFLYHSRLAINDLTEAGHEPMLSKCGSGAILCFNGEIYNYPDLRRECEAKGHRFQSAMDGEVILHLYEDYGLSAFERLNGIFAVAVVDSRNRTLVLTRDAMGVKPVFYRQISDGLAFASEPAQLRGAFGGSTWDVRGLAAFLTFLWIPAPWTAFKEIRSLRPGEILEWKADGSNRPSVVRGSHSLEYPSELEAEKAPTSSGAEVGALIHTAVRRQLLSDVPIGLMASGGTDSTLIWHSAKDVVRTGYTIQENSGVEGLQADADAASRYSTESGLHHRLLAADDQVLLDFPQTGDLLADPAFSLTRTIAREARHDGIPVLLSGQGADEVLGGYRRHSAAVLLEQAPDAVLRRLARIAQKSKHPIRAEYGRRLGAAVSATKPFDRYSQLYRYADSGDRAQILDTTEAEVADDVVFAEHLRTWRSFPDAWSLTKKAVTLDLQVYLPGLGLTYADRASMSHGIEVRVPWLDRDVVRWSLEQSAKTLVGFRSRKIPASEYSRRVLPRYVWDRPKVGFGIAAERFNEIPSGSTDTQRHAGYIAQCVRALADIGFSDFPTERQGGPRY